jgi:hypothetical protein
MLLGPIKGWKTRATLIICVRGLLIYKPVLQTSVVVMAGVLRRNNDHKEECLKKKETLELEFVEKFFWAHFRESG